MGNKVYRLVNSAIVADNAYKLQQWMPFIRAVNKFCIYQNRIESNDKLTVWRRSRMTSEQASQLLIGGTYRPAMFVSTTECRSYAFGNEWEGNPLTNQYYWEIRIPVSSWQYQKISSL